MRTREWNDVCRRGRPGASGLLFAGLLAVWIGGVANPAGALSAADVYRAAAGSVVLIFGFEEGAAGNSGAGSLLTSDGLVLTNDHVVADVDSGRLFSKLVVYFKPNPISGENARDLTEPYRATVVARDRELDLALIRVEGPPSDLTPLAIGDSEEVDVGEDVAAIGHPGGGGLWTLTTGTISSKRRDQARDIFQTDAAINPGSSGGPLLDANARLVGVNTFVRRVNEQGLPLEGLNYSLRSAAALRWVNAQAGPPISMVSRLAEAEPLERARREGRPAAPPSPSRVESRPSLPVPESSVEGQDASPNPSAPVPTATQASRGSGPRAFTAPDGTFMFGVPNAENDLSGSLSKVRETYSTLDQRREESVEEMDRLFEDYEDF